MPLGVGGPLRTVTTAVVAAMALATTLVATTAEAAEPGAVPRPDHVVVLILENHSSEGIIGNPDAPYLNSLAQTGANMTQSYGVTHPSQPNYIALFSGALNGVLDNTCPTTINAPNLGAQLFSAGFSFVGYSEGLPSPGYAGCGSGAYARKHNPWVNFPSVPASSNQPFTAFPTDFATLPTVSMVVPDLQNDMHDGTILQADTWIHDKFDAYVSWAKQHNSVLIVTWDEDDTHQSNHIPTMIVGGGIRTGNYTENINHYNVLRTIQDAYGLPPIANSTNAAPIVDIWNTSPGQPPVASFIAQCAVLTCSTNAAASSDADGTVSSYLWNWGDGTASTTGVTSSHIYADPGTYIVTLTVTDNDGLVGSTTRPAVVSPPGAFTYASDGFGRTLASGWGTADVGGPWSPSGSLSVGAGTGKLKLPTPGAGSTGALSSVSALNVDLAADAALDKSATGGGSYVILKARRNSNSNYSAKLRWSSTNQLTVYLSKIVTGVETTLKTYTLPGVTATPGAAFRLRFEVLGVGPTTLSAKAWRVGTTQPASWQVTTTDSSAPLQVAGSLVVYGYLSSSSTNAPQEMSVDNLLAVAPGFAPNLPPVAVANVGCTASTCNADGSGSTDADGTITGYSWNWGDGTAATTGVSSTHTYAAAGTYSVVLTTTDNSGGSDTDTATVTVTPPANQPPAAAASINCTALSCSASGSASADPDGTISGYSWNWGDDTATSTGVTSTHAYAAAGTYNISLTVTDDKGATDTSIYTVSLTAPPSGTSFVSDAFGRTTTNGLGLADVGGAWTTTGSKSAYSVTGGVASLKMPTGGSGATAFLGATLKTDTDLRFGVITDKIADSNGTYVTVSGRRVASNLEYDARIRLRANGPITIALSALKGSSTVVYLRNETILPGLTATTGVPLRVRLQVTGTNPTTIQLKVWSSTISEPTGWQMSVTDTTAALQTAGAVGVGGYLSSGTTNAPIVLRLSDLSAGPVV